MRHLADRLRWRPPVEGLGAPIPVGDDAVHGVDEHGVVRQAQEIGLLPQRGGIALVLGVKAGIFQGDRGLRRQEFEHREPARREDMGGEIILQVEHTDKLGLFQQRQAEHRMGVPRMHIRIGGKRMLG